MSTAYTCNAPSFGDEEFEVPAATEQVYALGKQHAQFAVSPDNYSTSIHYTHANMGDRPSEQDLKRSKSERLTEPQKPVSAYALFFRDTQAAIKGQNPDASFEEVSKIVTSMWDALDPGHKNVYKKKTEAAKKEYLKAMAAYRASLSSRGEDSNGAANNENGISSPEKNPAASPKNSKLANSGNLASAPPNQETPSSPQRASQIQSECTNLKTPETVHAQISLQSQSSTDQSETTTTESNEVQRCIREGCTNLAVINADWEDEYCSNECVITHCRNVFSQWVQANSMQADAYSAS